MMSRDYTDRENGLELEHGSDSRELDGRKLGPDGMTSYLMGVDNRAGEKVIREAASIQPVQ